MTSLDATTRCVIECLPTGAGKTLIYLAEAMMTEGRVVVLTSTKGQQDQIIDSVPELIASGVVADVRGQMNYRCEAVMPGGEFEYLNPGGGWVPVAEGPCHEGATCSLKDGGCGYYDSIRKAQKAKIGVTNYAFWMTNPMMEPRFQLFKEGEAPTLLICDEAHETVNEVCGFLATEITQELERDIKKHLDVSLPEGLGVEAWHDWGCQVADRVELALEDCRDGKKRRELNKIGAEVKNLSRLRDDGNWVGDHPFNPEHARNKTLVRWDIVWPRGHAEWYLFRRSAKILLSSATVLMKTATLLGLEEKDVTMFEAESNFKVENRPIYRIPCVQMNHRNEEKEEVQATWIKMIEKIAEERLDRQGLIHTVSYKRRNLLMKEGRMRREVQMRIVSHSTSDARTVIKEFISYSANDRYSRSSSPGPRILASPSVTTGYDFKDDAARWQVAPKLPIADTRAKVMKARCQQDPEYGPYYTSTTLQQLTGRVVRNEEDWGETFITDDNIVWFLKKWKRLFNQWWLDAYIDWERREEWRVRRELPKPRPINQARPNPSPERSSKQTIPPESWDWSLEQAMEEIKATMPPIESQGPWQGLTRTSTETLKPRRITLLTYCRSIVSSVCSALGLISKK